MNPKGTFRKVLLILWKNYLFRKRRFILTLMEILAPVLFILIIVYPQVSETEGPKKDLNIVKEFTPGPIKKEDLGLPKKLLAFSPNCARTRSIMKELDDNTDQYITMKEFSDERKIEMYIADLRRRNGDTETTEQAVSVAVVFQKGLSNPTQWGPKISYKIRLPATSDSSLTRARLQRTDKFFARAGRPGDGAQSDYIQDGFIRIQIELDTILIQRLTPSGSTKLAIPNMTVQELPYPVHSDAISIGVSDFPLLMWLVLGYMFIVPTIVLNVVSEKQSGIKELMKMMGLPNWIHCLGWMVNTMCLHLVTITIIVILLCHVGHPAYLRMSDPSLVWVSLLLYVFSATSFCFFISALFQTPILANIVAIIVWIVTFYGTIIPIDGTSARTFTIYDRMAVALLPNYAAALLVAGISGLETKNVGAQWKFIGEPISSLNPLTIGHSWLMFIVDTILYMSLTIYLENIVPSEYGIRKPWYYIFQPSTWGCLAHRSAQITPAAADEGEGQSSGFEAEPTNLTAGIVIKKLSKRFGRNKIAVDNVSFKMFDGQITVLLGHNGAGKTTTMSILTGLFSPSSGTAIINGYDIRTQIDDVRSSLGLCPQHNLLFEKLTVEEHLVFFGRLKGLTSRQAKAETTSLLQQIRLQEKRTVLSKNLSGGQQRKLSLGISLIGGTKVLILDEPTSGMDPEARRAIWDILLEMRGSRTILLTTHFMEEADVLGDRIAIMAEGKLQCCGTPSYLKKFYGAGYTLAMTIEENANKEEILLTVQKHIPTAFWKFQKFSSASEIAITLPTEGESTSYYPAMFKDLTENKESLGIRTMGLSLTTMDEVFVKVGELLTGEDHTHVDLNTQAGNAGGAYLPPNLVKFVGLNLFLQQFWGLFLKRIICTSRQLRLFLVQLLTPVLFLIGAIAIINSSLSPTSAPHPLTMTLSDYKDPKTLFYSSVPALKMSYPAVVGSSAIHTSSNLVSQLLAAGRKDEPDYRAHYIVSAKLDSSVTALFSSIAYHSSPLSVNLVSNAILRARDPTKRLSIEVTNHPLFDELSSLQQAEGAISFLAVASAFSIIVNIGLALFAASFIVFPIEEKICKGKQLQLMTGVSPLTFWVSSFLWDFLVMVVLVLIMLACFPIFQKFEVFTAHGGAGVLFLILLIYGYTAISFSYMCSLFLKSVSGGFAFVSTVHIVTGLFFPSLIFIFEIGQLVVLPTIFRLLAWPFPNFGVSIALLKFCILAIQNSRCNVIPSKYKQVICEGGPDNATFQNLYECCEKCSNHEFHGCFKPQPYLQWEWRIGPSVGIPGAIPGIGQEIFYVLIIGILFNVILLLSEYGVLRRVCCAFSRSKNSAFSSPGEEDVLIESQRVQEMIQTGRVGADALVVGNLCKSYGKFSAVANLSFGVHYGECFGLLGVNGAGKTTTFRMLTGDEIRSSGNAFGFNCTLEKNRAKFLRNIGYCPQYDGIVGVMTGKEILQLFGRLRGIPRKHIKSEANKWLQKMGLQEAGNVQCKNYSGGMKRRLSAGVALMGEPRIILLDEPTSGVDPVSRRHFWKVLAELREQGQSIILTSHSMEECEALCSRLGIMVNGQFQCFGGVQHLKKKFAQGFSLFVKLKPLIPFDSVEANTLQSDIRVAFQPCVLKDQHQIDNTTMPWNEFFQIMEDLKVQFQNIIEDYSVNETTLEEVFLSFARLQYPERVANVSACVKCTTCQCACFS